MQNHFCNVTSHAESLKESPQPNLQLLPTRQKQVPAWDKREHQQLPLMQGLGTTAVCAVRGGGAKGHTTGSCCSSCRGGCGGGGRNSLDRQPERSTLHRELVLRVIIGSRDSRGVLGGACGGRGGGLVVGGRGQDGQ